MNKIIAGTLSLGLLLGGCESSLLDEEVYSELGPTNFFRSEQDAMALLYSAYDIEQNYNGPVELRIEDITADITIQRSGGERRQAQPFEDFTWDATHPELTNFWDRGYRAIARTNLALEEVPKMTFSEDRKQQIVAEARFIRAESYIVLDGYWGPVPLITSSEVDPDAQPARATEEELNQFIESELLAVAEVLPTVAPEYPRATRGAALALLARHYLNNQKWQQAADAAKRVMDLGVYSLFSGAHRMDMFKVEHERNPEFIHVRPFVTNLRPNNMIQRVAPPGYRFKAPPKANWATQYKILSSFLSSFHPKDQRKDVIITEYRNMQGRLVKLGKDNARAFKYQEDLNATGVGSGNDIPVIRYADVLLIRAEALNELRGPNQESIDLINEVRAKAGVPPVTLAQLSSKQALRDHILKERGWEFYYEGRRREDLIRHGRFIELARQRGKNAQPHHVVFPIPQDELDKNPNLKQNPGY